MKRLLLLALMLSISARAQAGWRDEADARIERLRKGDFTVEVRGADGAAVGGARVEVALARHAFLFGTAIASGPFADTTDEGRRYRQFILENFNALVCENEMKWYATEVERGQEKYAPADALLAFAEENGLRMRGHCLFWEKLEFVQPWLAALETPELRTAIERRLTATAGRYAGRLVSWDVNNEMLDGSFYRDRIGIDGISGMFKEAARLDPKAKLFVNEYAIFGNPEKTERFLALIRELQARGAPVGGIGIQSHDSDRLTENADAKELTGDRPDWMMNTPLTPEMFLVTLDRLHSQTGLPIHLTEISARTPDAVRRGDALEMLFRLGFSHESVGAIMLWGFGAKTHWMGPDAALVDADGTVNAAGQRIGHLLREEWTTRAMSAVGAEGAKFRGFFGTYTVKVVMPDGREIVREVELSKDAPTAIVSLAP